MKSNPTLPNMAREQARELKQLHARFEKIEGNINKAESKTALLIQGMSVDLAASVEKARKKHEKEIGKLTALVERHKRPLQKTLDRIRIGKTPAHKERAAIARRIAVLEGRSN